MDKVTFAARTKKIVGAIYIYIYIFFFFKKKKTVVGVLFLSKIILLATEMGNRTISNPCYSENIYVGINK